MVEAANELGRTQFARMASLVKEDEAKGPLHAAFGRFGSPIVSRRGLADEVEEAGRLGCRCGGHENPPGMGRLLHRSIVIGPSEGKQKGCRFFLTVAAAEAYK